MESTNQRIAVKEQYKTADNLNTRISIHAKYSTNKLGFGNWLFSHYDLSPNSKVLELGCGTGDIWKAKLPLLDKTVTLTLTDFSKEMISITQNTLGEQKNIFFDLVDIETIPYPNHCFDRVIANMMLYHVPNLDKGLSEVRRVLNQDGYFYCATYGENGIMPFITGLCKNYGITDTTNKRFTLQNGATILKNHFSHIQRLDYQDSLAVTKIDDVLDYIYSLTNRPPVAELGRQTLKKVLEKEMVHGILNIPKEYGMFICQK